jgi:hypothetical protein
VKKPAPAIPVLQAVEAEDPSWAVEYLEQRNGCKALLEKAG